MENKIYFISGVSGAGKSSTLEHLKKLLPPEKYDIRDLDERGVPDGGGLTWLNSETRHWLDVAKSNAAEGKSTIICGFANPEFLKDVHKPGEDVPVQIILLHVSKDVLKQRLKGRHSTPESIKEIERTAAMPFEQFMENSASFTVEFREICEKYNCPVIETDTKSPEETAREIVRIITA